MICCDPVWGANLKSICLSMRLAVATRGSLPVERACSSRLEEMIWVVISVSAAVPAPQQLNNNIITQQRQLYSRLRAPSHKTLQIRYVVKATRSKIGKLLTTCFSTQDGARSPCGLVSTRANNSQPCSETRSSCHLLNVGWDVVDLGAVLVCHHHALSGSGVSPQDDAILQRETQSKPTLSEAAGW